MATPSSGTVVDPLFLSFQLALAGRYSIDRELGRGGMGIVYLAREVHLDRPVAIKLLPPDRSTLRSHFMREARLAAKLSHPNIIPIHSVEETNEFVYYVMSFIDGETLTQRVRTRGPLGSSEGARVLREVAWALSYSHAQGLVHRDVKPDNILLEFSTGRVLVADFGIAAAALETNDLSIAGTPEFMSPEQALGQQLDARSDLYGLGATAFYAFSGRFPFEGRSATEILARQVTEPAPALSSLGIAVPRKLAAIVDRCLAKEPDLRPPSAQALAEQLGVALDQRRELPAALRAFVKRSARLDGAGTMIAGFGLAISSIAVSSWLGGTAGLAALALSVTVIPFAYLTRAARRLSLLGFTHQDIGPAFHSEIEQAKEELSVDQHRSQTLTERLLAPVSRLSGLIFGTSFASLFVIVDVPVRPDLVEIAAITMGLSGVVFTTTTVGLLALLQRRKDVDTEVWSRLWNGRIGRAAFALARRLLGRRAPASAMTHRATELSLGMAAEQLYESLPAASRRALGDLPAMLVRLQNDAQSLRRRYDELQEALADAGDVAASEEYADLRATRDLIKSRLGDAVGALETIRLNLLRLHAGSATVESLTTHMDLAAEVSAEVERLILAHGEVERAMRFPRAAAATPA